MKTYVWNVPEGIEEGGQILLTVWSDSDLRRDGVPPGDYVPEVRYEVATRGPLGFGIRVWSIPLDLDSKG